MDCKSISFWKGGKSDLILEIGSISVFSNTNITNDIKHPKVVDFSSPSMEWNWHLLRLCCLANIVLHISKIPPPCSKQGSDQILWKPLMIGTFLVKLAYEMHVDLENHQNVPLWRLFHAVQGKR